jgi:hypothetical protein
MIVQFAERAGSRRSLLFESHSAGAASGVGECETAIERISPARAAPPQPHAIVYNMQGCRSRTESIAISIR